MTALGCFLARSFTGEIFATQARLDSLFAGVTLRYLLEFRPRAFSLIHDKLVASNLMCVLGCRLVPIHQAST